jgi:hypothetical protein
MALIFVFAGFGVVLVGLAGYTVHLIRNAEQILPDFDSAGAVAAPGAGSENDAGAEGSGLASIPAAADPD